MKFSPFWLVLLLALPVPCAYAADAGIVSIVDGPCRLLRDTTWYKLVPGARLREGDILVAAGTGQIQVELATGGAFNLGAPGTLFAVAVPMSGDKLTGPVELSLTEGWLKLSANAPPAGFRVQVDPTSIEAIEAVVVMHAAPGAMELFVESGIAKIGEVGTPKGKTSVGTELKGGDYAAQSTDRPLRLERLERPGTSGIGPGNR